MLRHTEVHMLRHHILVCCDICILRCWDMSALWLLKHSQIDIHMLRCWAVHTLKCWDIHTLMCHDAQRWDIHRLTQGHIPRSRCWDFHTLIYRDIHGTWWDSPMLRCWDIRRLRCKDLLIHLSDFKHQMTCARPEIQTWVSSPHPLMNFPSAFLPAAVLVPPWRSPPTVSIHAYGILHLPAWRCYLGPGGCATPTWAGKKHCGSTYVDKIWGMNTPVSSPVSGWTLSPRGSMLELSPRHPQW